MAAPSERHVPDKGWQLNGSCDPERFLQEAKITGECIQMLQSRFDKFCEKEQDSAKAYLTPGGFRMLNHVYKVCKAEDEAHFFRAMDHTGENRINFDDVLMGAAAASPMTPHILNSYTGRLNAQVRRRLRARYIFDFYNTSRSGTLDFEELAGLLADTRKGLQDDVPLQQYAAEVAKELGKVSVVTLHVLDVSGPLCELRVSTRWSGLRLQQEMARRLQVPVQGQKILVDSKCLTEQDVLDRFVAAGGGKIDRGVLDVTHRTNWEHWPFLWQPTISDGLGLERLVYVTFEDFYKAFASQQLPGTSKLFRFSRSVLHKRSSGCRTAALGGA